MRNRLNSKVDFTLITIILILFFISTSALFSASKSQEERFGFNFAYKQTLWFAIGFSIFFLIALLSYQRCLDAAYILYFLNIAALIVIFFSGSVRYGAQRWIAVGGFMIQPSEFMKFSCILTFARYLGGRKESLTTLKDLIAPLALIGIPFLLVLAQPDLGTALSLVPIFLAMIYVAGMPGKYIMPKPHSRNSGVSLMPHYLEAHPASDKRMPRLIQPQLPPANCGLPPGFYGEYIPCTDAAANTSNSYIQRQCKTQNKDLGTFSVYNTDNVRISKVPPGLISPKCKENSQVRFFSNSGLKGTEYIMANKSGCYKFEYNKKGNIPLKSFLIPKGWILKIIYNNNNKKQAHEYIGLRAVQNFSKSQAHIHSICIVKL